uniref:Uncharacterized protein n=1 Tax=Cacopsylla melanoneura TaxID=428564 RepID=A0A8D8QZ85_9HEMI
MYLLKTTCQNIILRVINKKHRLYNTKLLYSEYDVFNLRELYAQKLIIYAHKTNIWNASDHTHNTRRHNQINIPRVNKKKTQRHFIFLGPIIYNIVFNTINTGPIGKISIISKKLIQEKKLNQFWDYLK